VVAHYASTGDRSIGVIGVIRIGEIAGRRGGALSTIMHPRNTEQITVTAPAARGFAT
jgi:hypothetical protein